MVNIYDYERIIKLLTFFASIGIRRIDKNKGSDARQKNLHFRKVASDEGTR